MITIKTAKYSADDAIFVASVINRGLCGHCEKYSSFYDFKDINCEGCTHKTACSDLRSAYYFMLAKSLRVSDGNSTELLDS